MDRFNNEQILEIRKLYNDGINIGELAKRFNSCYPTISKLIINKRSPSIISSISTRIYSDTLIDKVINEYQSGLTSDKVAKKFNISPASVLRFLKNKNIKTREISRSCNDHFFDTLDSEQKLYWFGFIIADGCIKIRKTKHYLLEFNLGKKDKNHLELFASHINYDGPINEIRVKHSKNNKIYTHLNLCISRKTVVNALCRLGAIEIKNGDPTPLMQYSNEQIRHILRGFFDGDGSIMINNRNDMMWYICGEHRETLEYFMSRCPVVNRHNATKESIYRVQYGGNKIVPKICGWLYNNSTIYLKRKKDIYDNRLGIIQSRPHIKMGQKHPYDGGIPMKWKFPQWPEEHLKKTLHDDINYKPDRLTNRYADFSLTKHFYKSFWMSTRQGCKPIYEVFNNKNVMEKSINALKNEGGKITYNRFLRQVSFHTDYKYPSIMSPRLSSEVAHKYAQPGYMIYDPCAGWGTRYLGLINRPYTYVCSESNSHIRNDLLKLVKWCNYEVNVYSNKLEDNPPIQQADMIWTSPPFDNTEIYYNGEEVNENIYDRIFDVALLLKVKTLVLHLPRIIENSKFTIHDKTAINVRSLGGNKRHCEYIIAYKFT